MKRVIRPGKSPVSILFLLGLAVCVGVWLLNLLANTAPANAQDRDLGARVVLAQGFAPGQGGPQGPPMGPGGFPGGFQPPPFVMGTVAEVDKNTNTIYVESFFGQEQEVKVTSTTKLVTQASAKVAELKVGDRVQVQGTPTGIAASSMTIGEPPDALSFRPPTMPQRQGTNQPGAAPQAMAFASASGTVKALNPLTIAVGTSITLTVRVSPDARINKFVATTLANIKEGDRVMAAGTRNADGSFAATAVGINMGGPGMGPFGPGMRGGPGMGPAGQPGAPRRQGQPPNEG